MLEQIVCLYHYKFDLFYSGNLYNWTKIQVHNHQSFEPQAELKYLVWKPRKPNSAVYTLAWNWLKQTTIAWCILFLLLLYGSSNNDASHWLRLTILKIRQCYFVNGHCLSVCITTLYSVTSLSVDSIRFKFIFCLVGSWSALFDEGVKNSLQESMFPKHKNQLHYLYSVRLMRLTLSWCGFMYFSKVRGLYWARRSSKYD